MPQAFEIPWAQLEFFSPGRPPPANATVVEVRWPSGRPAQASWWRAPAGWRVVASDRTASWVTWRKLGLWPAAGYRRLTSVTAISRGRVPSVARRARLAASGSPHGKGASSLNLGARVRQR